MNNNSLSQAKTEEEEVLEGIINVYVIKPEIEISKSEYWKETEERETENEKVIVYRKEKICTIKAGIMICLWGWVNKNHSDVIAELASTINYTDFCHFHDKILLTGNHHFGDVILCNDEEVSEKQLELEKKMEKLLSDFYDDLVKMTKDKGIIVTVEQIIP